MRFILKPVTGGVGLPSSLCLAHVVKMPLIPNNGFATETVLDRTNAMPTQLGFHAIPVLLYSLPAVAGRPENARPSSHRRTTMSSTTCKCLRDVVVSIVCPAVHVVVGADDDVKLGRRHRNLGWKTPATHNHIESRSHTV